MAGWSPYGEPTKPEDTESPTWGDYGTTFKAGLQDLQSAIQAGARYLNEVTGDREGERYYRATGKLTDMDVQETLEGLTPAARKRLTATVTSEDFWSHPFSSVALKGTRMTPTLAASIVPAFLLPGAGAATAGAAVAGGALTAAQTLDDLYQQVDEAPEEKLLQVPYYAGLRSMGMSEEDARRDYGATIRGNKPAMMFLLGVLTNAVGPAGQIARATKGATASATGTGGNILTRTGKGFAEGALSEAVEEGAQNSAVQSAAIQGGLQREFDYGKLLDASLEGALLGGVFGTAAGAAGGRGQAPVKPITTDDAADKIEDKIEVVKPKAPSAAEQAALTASQPTPAGQATTSAPEGVPPDVAAASERLATPKADPLAGIQTQGGGGGMAIPGADIASETAVPPKVANAVERVKARAKGRAAPEVPQVTQPSDPELTAAPPSPTPEGALDVPPGAGDVPPVTSPVTPQITPQGNTPQPTGRVLRPVGEEETDPDMVAPLTVAPERKEKGSVGSKDTKTLAKRQADGDLARQAFDEINANHALPTTDAERKTLAKRVKAIVDGLEGLGIKIPAKAAYKHAKNPTPDSLVWAREMKDLLTELEKDPKGTTARAKRDERVNTKLANWRLAKETGDFTQMRDDRIAGGTEAKSRTKGGKVDEIATIAAEQDADTSADTVSTEDVAGVQHKDAVDVKAKQDDTAPEEPKSFADKDNDTVQTKASGSAMGARLIEGNKFDKEKGEWVIEAAPVRKVAITDELRRQYEQPATPKSGVTPESNGAAKVAEIKKNAKKKAGAKTEAVKARVKKKPASPKGQLEAARKETVQPTEAQKEAGNYRKPPVDVQGVTVRIEIAKGDERSGKDPSGKTWSVKMPVDYGHDDASVKGADGDKLDVFIGPHLDSPHVFIIDQHHLVNGERGGFDEHKVMLGFRDGDEAMRTYERAFSDGRGFDRIGQITQMSVEEYKLWRRKGDTTKPAADLVHATHEEGWGYDNDDILHGRANNTVGARDQSPVRNEHSISVANRTVRGDIEQLKVVAKARLPFGEAFERWVGKDAGGKHAFIYNFLGGRIRSLAKDVPTYVVSDKDMAYLTQVSRMRNAADGGSDKPPIAYMRNNEQGKPILVVSEKLLKDYTRDHIRLVLIHEANHAVVANALYNDKRLAAAAQVILDYLNVQHADIEYAFGKKIKKEYGLTNIDELVAEGVSNPHFQKELQYTELPDEVANQFFSLLPNPPSRGMLKTLWDAFLQIVRHALHVPNTQHTMTALEAVLNVQYQAEIYNARVTKKGEGTPATGPRYELQPLFTYADDIKNVFTGAAKQEQQGSPKLLKIATWNQMAAIAERFFPNNPVKRLYDLREERRVRAEKILRDSEPLTHRHVELERKYTKVIVGQDENGKPTTMWDHYSQLVHDETYAGVFADKTLEQNSHLGKDTLDGAWSKAQHARLAAMYAKLPEDLRALRRDTMKYYTDQQNQMSLDIIKNRVLVALGIDDASMAQRIFDETHTEADIKSVGGKRIMDLILQAGALKKIKGPYFPLMRHGGYVVQGFYKVTPPSNGKLIEGTTYEFKDRDEALAYAKQQGARPTVKSVWVDENTGLTYGVEADGTQVRITSKDSVAEQRWRVTVQDKHVEFFATQREAQRAAKQLEDSGEFREVKGVENKRYERDNARGDLLASDVRKLKEALERRSHSGFTPHQKRELEQALGEASIRFLGSTRIQSRRLPRTYAAGASKDLTRVLWDYANSVSGYVAKLEYGPKIEATLKEIVEHSKGDAAKDTSLGRSAIANEIERRIDQDDVRHVGMVHTAAQRLMTLSFIDKLASPAYSIVGVMQAAVVGMPVLAGRHGVGASVSEMTKAYNDVAGFSIIKHALGEVGRAFKGDHHKATYLEDIKSRIRDEGERKMLELLEQLGTIDADAGLELSELSRAQPGNTRTSQVLARADKALGYVENIARQMPKAVEVINRSVMALSAYRLEMRKTGNHDRAVAYAQKVVDETQFNYSTTNAAPVFNHPLAKLALQFRKYGQALYYLLGSQVGKAYRGGSHGERAEALKTLGLIATTHMAVAGALGLPTEPIKYLLMGAKAFGLTATGWDDVEEIVRQYAAQTFGKAGGEIFSKGLPRALGLDVSSRMGLDSLVAFGEPKSDKENDVKKWLFDTLAGAPAALVTDYIKGTNHLWSGEFVKAAELMVPLKVAADSIRAYRQSTEGKKASTGRQLSEPYSLYEAGLRVVGFTPAREAEEGAKAAAFRNQTVKAGSERSRLVNAWINAKGADKVKAQRAVQQYNSGVKSEYRITQKDLTNAMKRREREGVGITTNNRTRSTYERLEQIYQ